MKTYSSLTEFDAPENGCVLTIGNFDGVHLGHQAILQKAREVAQKYALPLVGMTFYPPPVAALRPDKQPSILTPLEVKKKLLAQQGIEHLIIVEPTIAFLSLEPEEFTEKYLIGHLRAKHVVEGQTFGFGRQRTGTIISLQELARKYNFQSHLVPARTIVLDDTGSLVISSTLVRQQVALGQFVKTKQCLGRDYLLAGRIIPGRGTGRRLGFPTANLELHCSRQVVPEDAVFAGYARLGSKFHKAWSTKEFHRAAISIGRSETFSHAPWQIEAFLLDYPAEAESLYDKTMLLAFVEKVRAQERFKSPEALIKAIKNDCEVIERVLTAQGPPKAWTSSKPYH